MLPSPGQEELPEQETPEEVDWAAVLGHWVDGTFINEHLGLRVDPPQGWVRLDQEGLALAIQEGQDIPEEFLESCWESENPAVTCDLIVSNTTTGANIQVIHKWLGSTAGGISVFELMELFADSMREVGMEVNLDNPDTTRIGEHDWHSFDTVTHILDTVAHSRSFFSVRDGFGAVIYITYHDRSETLEEILAMFDSLQGWEVEEEIDEAGAEEAEQAEAEYGEEG